MGKITKQYVYLPTSDRRDIRIDTLLPQKFVDICELFVSPEDGFYRCNWCKLLTYDIFLAGASQGADDPIVALCTDQESCLYRASTLGEV